MIQLRISLVDCLMTIAVMGQQQQHTEESSNSNTGGGNTNLTRLEKYMVTKVWTNALSDERMTWSLEHYYQLPLQEKRRNVMG